MSRPRCPQGPAGRPWPRRCRFSRRGPEIGLSFQKVSAVPPAFSYGLMNHTPKDTWSCVHVCKELQLHTDTVIHSYTNDVLYIKYRLYYTTAQVFVLKIQGGNSSL